MLCLWRPGILAGCLFRKGWSCVCRGLSVEGRAAPVTCVCLLLQDPGGASAEAPLLQGTPGAPAPLPGEPSRGAGAALQTDRQHPG